MECNFTNMDLIDEKTSVFYPFSLGATAQNQNCFFSNDFNFQLGFCQSPMDEPQVLSQSLTLNELEDLDDNSERILSYEGFCNNQDEGSNTRPQLFVEGVSYHYDKAPLVTGLPVYEKRNSFFSTHTRISEPVGADCLNSPTVATDSKVLTNLTATEGLRSSFQINEIKVERLNRKMCSFKFSLFNSFSLNQNLLSKSKDGDKQPKNRKIRKGARKEVKGAVTTKRGRKGKADNANHLTCASNGNVTTLSKLNTGKCCDSLTTKTQETREFTLNSLTTDQFDKLEVSNTTLDFTCTLNF